MIRERVNRESARHLRRQKALEKRFIPKFFELIKGQYRHFIDVVGEHGLDYAKGSMDHIITITPWIPLLKKYYRMAAYIESNAVMAQVKSGLKRATPFSIGFDDLAEVVDEYFKIYMFNKSAFPISETTKKDIIRFLIREVDGGKTLDEALRDFKELAIDGKAQLSYKRAQRIAQTEGTRAMNFGGVIGGYMTGVDLDKIWVTVHDERVRPTADFPSPYSHRALDLARTDLMKPFYNGEKIRYPGDPEAHPANTVNCRCSLVYLEKQRIARPPKIRRLQDFIVDFFLGFVIGQSVVNEFSNE